jgi:hypothetical protein
VEHEADRRAEGVRPHLCPQRLGKLFRFVNENFLFKIVEMSQPFGYTKSNLLFLCYFRLELSYYVLLI